MPPSSGAADLRFANSSDPGTAYAFYPSAAEYGGDVWFGAAGDDPVPGTYDYHAVMHEIGHALGLKHGHETGGYGSLPAAYDSHEYSIMTYRSYAGAQGTYYTNEAYGGPQSFMMLDIAALQHLYGADFETNAGDTVYRWTPGVGHHLRGRRGGDHARRQPHPPDGLGRRRHRHLRPLGLFERAPHRSRPGRLLAVLRRPAGLSRRRHLRPRQRLQRPAVSWRRPLADRERDRRLRRRPDRRQRRRQPALGARGRRRAPAAAPGTTGSRAARATTASTAGRARTGCPAAPATTSTTSTPATRPSSSPAAASTPSTRGSATRSGPTSRRCG